MESGCIDEIKNLYEKLENRYEVIYPESDRATYTSLLNYTDETEKPFQRWYRYKEGFSTKLVKHLIEEYSQKACGTILDPFAGSGSTIIGANQLGYRGVGFEVNPFSYFLASCKTLNYSDEICGEFKRAYNEILNSARNNTTEYKFPDLSISDKVFPKEIEAYYMTVRDMISAQSFEYPETKNLLLLGWLSCIENASNYRKAGNGLKRRKYVKPREYSVDEIYNTLIEQYDNMYEDITGSRVRSDALLYNDSCLNMDRYLQDGSITGIIFSPPYANCFDYTEIYKLELWFGGFVSNYKELKELRNKSLHSHLNGILPENDAASENGSLAYLLKALEGRGLWDKRIPLMLRSYYYEMFRVLDKCYKALENDGFCCIIVGNSAYGGIVFPADLLLSEYAESLGFKVDKIEVDRYIITSSQQYKETEYSRKYLRESVVCLKKVK